MPTTTRRATSADVARHAGVSRTTVSYVVNGIANAGISAETRDRVLAAAAALGYSQYGPGRALKSGRSEVVLFVLNDAPILHAMNSFLDELDARLTAGGMSLLLYRVSPRGNPLSRIWREVGPFAVIGIDSISSQDAASMRKAGIDVIRLSLGGGDGSDAITRTEAEVGEAQVRFLAGRGHREIGYAYPDEARVITFATRRLEGARRACRELGLPDLDVRTVPLARAEAAEALLPWTGESRVTAVCAFNDLVAFAVLAGLRDNGVRVPEDVAVIGVDNDPVGELVSPSLTTIDTYRADTAARLAARIGAARASEPEPTDSTLATYAVVVRESAP